MIEYKARRATHEAAICTLTAQCDGHGTKPTGMRGNSTKLLTPRKGEKGDTMDAREFLWELYKAVKDDNRWDAIEFADIPGEDVIRIYPFDGKPLLITVENGDSVGEKTRRPYQR